MRKITTLFICLIGAILTHGQSAKKLFEEVKKANTSLSDYDDSTMYIQYEFVNRFTDEKTESSGSFLFYQKNHPYLFLGADIYSFKIFKADSVFIVNKNGDTTNRFEPTTPFEFDKSNPNGLYWLLTKIPTEKRGSFSKKEYSKPMLVYNNKDTFAIARIDKKWGNVHTFYFTKSHRIFRYEVVNDNPERPDSSWIYNFNYFKHNCFDSLNQRLHYGETPRPPYPPIDNRKDSLTYNKHDTVFLLNDSILTNFSGKFILFDYWYLSCHPCLQMMPFMNQLHQEIDTSKLIIIGVNPYDDQEHINRYLERKGYHVLQMNAKKMKPFHHIDSFPTLILLDADFNEVKQQVGYGGTFSDKEIRQMLKEYGLIR
ncbi:MAG: TlpA family protein disulfide reductase [Flavobacteriales bacterium]|nr:TlpA family protein disulfide reductase [Flavobacteriales bacterium]